MSRIDDPQQPITNGCECGQHASWSDCMQSKLDEITVIESVSGYLLVYDRMNASYQSLFKGMSDAYAQGSELYCGEDLPYDVFMAILSICNLILPD